MIILISQSWFFISQIRFNDNTQSRLWYQKIDFVISRKREFENVFRLLPCSYIRDAMHKISLPILSANQLWIIISQLCTSWWPHPGPTGNLITPEVEHAQWLDRSMHLNYFLYHVFYEIIGRFDAWINCIIIEFLDG